MKQNYVTITLCYSPRDLTFVSGISETNFCGPGIGQNIQNVYIQLFFAVLYGSTK